MNTTETLCIEAEHLADLLIQRPEIQDYRRAESIMNAHPTIVADLRRLRDLQEQIGDFMSRNVHEAHYQHLSAEVDALLSKLEGLPEVQNFLAAQTRVNELIQAITDRLSTALAEPTDN